jgi:hypothetical protein
LAPPFVGKPASDGVEPGHTPRPFIGREVRMLLSFQRPWRLSGKGTPSHGCTPETTEAIPRRTDDYSARKPPSQARVPSTGSVATDHSGRPGHASAGAGLGASRRMPGGRVALTSPGRAAPRGATRAEVASEVPSAHDLARLTGSLSSRLVLSPSAPGAGRRSRSVRPAARSRAPGDPRPAGSTRRGRSKPRAGVRGRWCRS